MKIAHVTKDEKMKNLVRDYEVLMKDTVQEFGLFEIMEAPHSWVVEE
jgi:hypothetical protein